MYGEKIKSLRKESGLSQKDFAKKTGLSISYIQQLERDVKVNPSIESLTKIAESLNVSLYSFLDSSTAHLHDEIVLHELTDWIKDKIVFAGFIDDLTIDISHNLMSILEMLRFVNEFEDKSKTLDILKDLKEFAEYKLSKYDN